MATDSLYWSTSLLLNFEGADASTTVTDISPTPKTATVAGNAQIDTAQFKSGAAALLLDGSGDYVTFPSDAGHDYGSGDFCVEFWWRPTSGTPGATQYLADYSVATIATNNDYAWAIAHNTAGKILAFVMSGTTQYPVGLLTSTTVLTSGAWVHIALVRASGVVTLFINGVAEATGVAAVALNTPASRLVQIGKLNNANYANGHMDGFRLTKGYARYTATFSPDTSLFEVSPTGTMDFDVAMPMPTGNAYGGGSMDVTMPMPVLEFTTGMRADLTAPMPTLDMTGRNTEGENEINLVAPMPTLDFQLGAQITATAPMPALDFEVTTTITVRIDVIAPMPSIDMHIVTTGLVSVQGTAPMPTLDMQGGAQVDGTAPMPTADISGTTGSTLTIVATAPMAELDMVMSSGGTMSFTLEMPMPVAGPWGIIEGVAPMARIEFIARSVVVVTYEAYAVNLKPGPKMPNQVTRYNNYPFNQIVRFQGRYIGVADDGLYELGGDTDYATPTPAKVAWSWKMGTTDFGSSQMKVDRQIVIGGRLGASVVASVSAGEKADVTYTYVPERGRDAQNYRVKLGKGFKARYYSFGLSGTGADGDIDTIDFDAQNHSRKI